LKTLGIVGAGSWGVALAIHAARAGRRPLLWARRPELVEEMARTRRSPYLEASLPDAVEPVTELAALADAEALIMVVPSHGFRAVLRDLLRELPAGVPRSIVSATKGIEPETLCRMSVIAEQEAGAAGTPQRFAVLSGPNFAAEVAAGLPAAAVVASASRELAAELQESLGTPTMRLYSSQDVVGVELGGATKNVIAIAAGVVAGLGLGHNTLAALITRGLHEVTRLGIASGGRQRTFAGLAGLGDLVLTCTGDLSRNRRTGLLLAAGKTLPEIVAETSMVAEGVRNSLAIERLAATLGVEMPITSQMVEVLYRDKPARRALDGLMRRELKSEEEP
jgi:glycerol-3-phosphate dehydrogenase (NAD(P)+)